MSDTVATKFEIVDKASDVLDRIAKSTAGADSKLGEIAKSLSKVDGAADGAGKKLAAVGGAGEKSGVGIGFVAGIMSKVTEKAIEMAAAIAAGTVSLVQFGINAASEKRDTVAALELIEGSAEGAANTYEALSRIADKTPFDTSSVITFGKTLRATGFDIRETSDVLAGLFDVGAVQGKEGPEKVKALLDGIVKIKGRDVFNAEILETITNAGGAAGLNVENLSAAIAKQRGISLEQGRALLKSGTIKGVEGINAILATVREQTDKGGPLGKATEIFGKASLDGQLSTLGSRFKQIFADIKIQPLVDIIQRVNDILSADSPTGQKVRAFVNDTLGSMFKKAGELLTPENIQAAIDKVLVVFETAKQIIGDLASGFGRAFDGLTDKINPLATTMDGFNKGAAAGTINWKEFGAALGDVANALVTIVGLTKEAAGIFSHEGIVNKSIFGALDSAADEDAKKDAAARAEAVARAAGDGTVAGLLSKVPEVKAATEILASSVETQTKSTLDIHSPSRKMHELGAFTAEGFRDGLESRPISASLDALLASPSGSFGGAGGADGGRPIVLQFGDIIVHGNADAATVASVGREVRASVESALLGLFEDMGAS